MDKLNDKKIGDISYPIWEFNYKPERYIHKSWIDSLPNSEIIEKLIKNDKKDESSRLSHYVMSQLGFNGSFYFDFSDPFTKIALWDYEKLDKLIMYVGVLFYGEEIKQLIIRDEVLQYRKSLGDEIYHFALSEADKLNPRHLSVLDLPKKIDIKNRVKISGLICFNESVQQLPLSILRRITVKLPKKYFHLTLKFAPKSKLGKYPKELPRSLVLGVIDALGLVDEKSALPVQNNESEPMDEFASSSQQSGIMPTGHTHDK